MSEEKYEEKVLKALNLIVDQTKPKPQSAESSEKHPTETFLDQKKESAIEHIDVCPTCRSQFKEKLRPEIFKEFKEKLKSKDLLTCDGCGEIVGKEEKECPTCKGTHAH